MVRFPCCDQNENLRKGAWTKEEDERLINYIRRHGQGSWKSLPRAAGLLRCGKSCRLRWINYLRPDLKRGNFTREEDDLIINLQTTMGNKWSTIASSLPGRTDNEIKNYWNTHLKRRLEDRDISQPQPKNNISTIIPPIQHAQYFTMQSDIAINPMVHNIFNVKKPYSVTPTSDYSSSNNNTFLIYNQEIKPEVNLELSMNLPQSNDAMKINDKFKLEKKWEIHYPQLFGKSLAASSAASSSVWPIAQEPVCLCYNLGGYLNGDNTCNKCQRVNVTDGAGDR